MKATIVVNLDVKPIAHNCGLENCNIRINESSLSARMSIITHELIELIKNEGTTDFTITREVDKNNVLLWSVRLE